MRSPTSSRAFTLIELLVVISVIAVLASMLLPAVSTVMESSRKSKCGNNLRQIGMAVVGYTTDADGRLPYYPDVIDPNRGHEGGPLEYLLADQLGDEYPAAFAQSSGSCSGNRLYLCPSGPYRTTKIIWGGSKRIWVDGGGNAGVYDNKNSYEGSMYYLYSASVPGVQDGKDLNLSRFRHTPQVPWQFCSSRGAPAPHVGNLLQGYAMHVGYERPTLFLDGHVKTLVTNQGRVGGGNLLYSSTQTLMIPANNVANYTFAEY